MITERNQQIFEQRRDTYNAIPGVRVGDWARQGKELSRVTHIWDKSFTGGGRHIQTGGGLTSFYLGDGYISYSGSLDPGISEDKLRDTGELKDGRVWFFKDNFWKKANSIDFTMAFRVFEKVTANMLAPEARR